MKKKIKFHNGKDNCDLCGRKEQHYQYGSVRDESKKQEIIFIFDYYSNTQQNKSIFDGKTGELLNGLLEECKIDKHDIVFMPSITCAGFRAEKIADIYNYHNELCDEIDQLNLKNIKKIITFGSWSIQTLLKRKITLKQIRQTPFKLGDIDVFCTFGFGQVMLEPGIYNDIISDVKQAMMGIQEIRDTDIYINAIYEHDQNKNYFSLDVETEGLNSFDSNKQLLSIAVTHKEGEAYVYNTTNDAYLDNGMMLEIVNILENPDYTMIGHNIKFDWTWLKNKFDNEIKCKLCDTKTMYIILDENSQDNGLKYLASKYTNIPKNYNKDIDTSNLKELAYNDFENLALYNGRDVDATLRLYNVLLNEIKEQGKENLLDFLNEVLLTIANIEYNGINIDMEYLEREREKCFQKYKNIEDSYKKFYPGLNLNSTKQLVEILYNDLKLPIIKRTDKGMPSTDKETLKYLLEDHATTDLQIKFLDDLLVYSREEKLYKTYFIGLPKEIQDGKIHTSYNLGRNATAKGSSGTVTGRLSSSNPNLTNIPRTDKKKGVFVRGCFAAREGYNFIDADYSQLELRIGAWYSKEKNMYQLFEKGEDIHTSVLSSILKRPYQELVDILNDENHKEYSTIKNTRAIAKSINFGIFYGAGANTIKNQARQAGLKITKDEAQEMINKWLSAYPKVNAWISKTKQHLIDNLEVSSPTGRTRHLLGANRQDEVGFGQLRQGVNFPIQTLASEVCLAGLIEVEKELEKHNIDGKIVLTVHDSIIVEYNKELDDKQVENVIKKAMTYNVVNYFKNKFNFDLNIPLEVSTTISDRWQ